MTSEGDVGKDSVAVLYQGGRLPSWDILTEEQQGFRVIHEFLLEVPGQSGGG